MFKQKKFPTGNKNAYAENRHMFTQGIIFIEKIQKFAFYIDHFNAISSIEMEVSDSAMSEESTSTASSSNVNIPFDDKSVCQVCFVKGNKIFAISNVPPP